MRLVRAVGLLCKSSLPYISRLSLPHHVPGGTWKGVKTCLESTEHKISPGAGYQQLAISARSVRSDSVSLLRNTFIGIFVFYACLLCTEFIHARLLHPLHALITCIIVVQDHGSQLHDKLPILVLS